MLRTTAMFLQETNQNGIAKKKNPGRVFSLRKVSEKCKIRAELYKDDPYGSKCVWHDNIKMFVVMLWSGVQRCSLLAAPSAAVNIWGAREPLFFPPPNSCRNWMDYRGPTVTTITQGGTHSAWESVACLPWGSAVPPVPTSGCHAPLRADQTRYDMLQILYNSSLSWHPFFIGSNSHGFAIMHCVASEFHSAMPACSRQPHLAAAFCKGILTQIETSNRVSVLTLVLLQSSRRQEAEDVAVLQLL